MKYIVARNNRARKILEQVSLSEEAFNLFELQPVTKFEHAQCTHATTRVQPTTRHNTRPTEHKA